MPIITAVAAIVLGVVLSFVWPPVQHGIDMFSHWAAVSDPRTAATVYGFVERLLIPFGLHHIWNVPFFFEMGTFTDATGNVVHGDINRFFAGDPTAGILAGAFLFKMFGLPAAAIAMWQAPAGEQGGGRRHHDLGRAHLVPDRHHRADRVLLPVSGAGALLHPRVLAASTQFIANTLGMHMGFTFSQGGIDFVLSTFFGKFSQKWWLVLVLGPSTP